MQKNDAFIYIHILYDLLETLTLMYSLTQSLLKTLIIGNKINVMNTGNKIPNLYFIHT